MNQSLYIAEYLSSNKKLQKLEKETHEKITRENARKLLSNQVVSVEMNCEADIVDKSMELLERHKYASNNR